MLGRRSRWLVALLGLVVLFGGSVAAAAPPQTRVPKVVVIGTGGTIAGVAGSRVAFQTYRSGQIPIADLVGFLQPEVARIADVSTVQFGNKGSGSYTIPEFYDLTKLVDQQLARADAVVVTTGTDTMEEFAYWLDLTVRSTKPVVLTGAMRPWNVVGTDGPANLYNAIALAASKRTTCFGTVLMLNDEVYPARDATKTSGLRMDTFQTREFGTLGFVDETRIRLHRAPARVEQCRTSKWATPFDLARIDRAALPRTEIVYSYQSAGGEPITAFADAGVRGIVTAGTGAGGVSAAQSAARSAAIQQGVVFVSTTRTGSGAVYDGGTGPVIGGEDLLPQKARLLLLLSLAKTDDVATIRDWFARYGVQEFR
jgi:L-asparaginase